MENSFAYTRYTDNLKQLLALLFVYVGLADDVRQAMRFLNGTADAYDAESGIGGGASGPARAFAAMASPDTISRRMHRLASKLLLPVEAATRRLVIVLAAKLPAPKISPSALHPAKRKVPPFKIIKLPRTYVPGVMTPLARPMPKIKPAPKPPVRIPRFQLLDPMKRFGRKRYAKRRGEPRILSFDRPNHPVRRYIKQTPFDQVSSVHLLRRVTALAYALDDLPKQAKRLARWRALAKARTAAGMRGRGQYLAPRSDPMRPGRPPGAPPRRLPTNRQNEEHWLVMDLDSLARQSRHPPYT